MDEEKEALQKNVGDRVWAYRTQAGMSRERLAELLGCSTQYVGDIEQGKKCMAMIYFVRLGKVFHVSLDTLAFGPQEDPALDRLVQRLKEMPPIDRDMAVHMILSAAEAVETMGREI